MSLSANTVVRYRISAYNRHEHMLRVDVLISRAQSDAIEIRFPRWIPGSYMLREYARHVTRVTASIAGNAPPLAISKIDLHTWRIENCAAGMASNDSSAGGAWTISFFIYAFDASVRGAFLDAARCYFNGAAVFPEVIDFAGSVEVEIVSDYPRVGAVATTLPSFAVDEHGFGLYRAKDYDALLDYPVEISAFERVDFHVAGVPHALIVSGAWRTDLARVGRDAAKICGEHVRFFHDDGAPPFEHYMFLLNVLAEGYGGLEHRDSTSLVCSVNDLPVIGDPTISEGYLQVLGLISHEYFHAWNVKRIRPCAFIPYDLAREADTTQLWIYEGFTSYYDDLALVRAGLITREDYLRIIGRNLTALARTPGRTAQSIADAGADAWIKYYRADENASNVQVSYYLKGGLLALLLDLTLRQHCNGSLDTEMRALWSAAQTENYRGTDNDDLQQRLTARTGQPWAAWFGRYVKSTEPLPLEAALMSMGVRVQWRPSAGARDRGGLDMAPARGAHLSALGIVLADRGEVKIRSVVAGSAAAVAGLSSGDTLIAIDERKLTSATLADTLNRFSAGDTLTVHYFRDNRLANATLKIPAAQFDTAWCTFVTPIEAAQAGRRDDWLGMSAPRNEIE